MVRIFSIAFVLAAGVLGCQSAPPFISPSNNFTQLTWVINDPNAAATGIIGYSPSNTWDLLATVGAPTNTWPLAGLPYETLAAVSLEPGAESSGSNQVTNTPPAVAPSGLTKK